MNDTRPMFTAADFRKSSYSDPNQDCVHVARRDGWVEVRDTKTVFGTPSDRRLALTAEQFNDLLANTRRRYP